MKDVILKFQSLTLLLLLKLIWKALRIVVIAMLWFEMLDAFKRTDLSWEEVRRSKRKGLRSKLRWLYLRARNRLDEVSMHTGLFVF